MIKVRNQVFHLGTRDTSYIFRVMESGHLEHLYYGRKVAEEGNMEAMFEKKTFIPGNCNGYSDDYKQLTLEDICLEMSSYGKGDIREPFVHVVHEDGSSTSDFLYDSHLVLQGKHELETMPSSYDEHGNAQQLKIVLKDKEYGLTLIMYYHVFEDCDVITRSATLTNDSNEPVQVKRLLSLQLDMEPEEYVFTTFRGAWAREMRKCETVLQPGKYVNASYTGTTSSRANNFVMLTKCGTTEDFGDCFGFHLIYSGNHYEMAEVSSFGKLRISTGINPDGFSWLLEPGETFETPEAAVTYSHLGCNGMSQHMHDFVRQHIVRGYWKEKERPVLLNSWEAAYFNINENKLLDLARAGKNAGIELFVMDDGWFGERNDDTSSLGDWQENAKKIPDGLDGFSERLKEMGLDFGIWVEPEMVNVKSHLYEEHPEWVLEIPKKPHSEGRNQRILDLTQEEVQEFIIETVSNILDSADISYVKWDMNRTFTDVFSKHLPKERQGEVVHRYYMGLYRCMKELTEKYPEVLFEGCAAGGNRFDLGILCYFPQIWASDDTDALCRSEMQTNYSYGYPMSVVSAHVSGCPNHQTLRRTPLETRFHVAAFGVCGYECNFSDMKKEELEAVKVQIALYKHWREVLQFGRFYRGESHSGLISSYQGALAQNRENERSWTCVSQDQKKAVGMKFQTLAIPNTMFATYKPKGLNPQFTYHFSNRNLKYNVKNFGDLVNTASPIHIKPDSIVHNLVAKFVKMDGETEDYVASGDQLMYAGVKLRQAFAGTGYNDQIRFYPDFASRMYFMEVEE